MTRPITLNNMRRLAVARQRLAGPIPEPSTDSLYDILESIRCLQIDPIRAVERTQYLVLFSRLGPFDPGLLDRLAYEERRLFEYWAHAASYVLTEDYPISRYRMDSFEFGNGVYAQRYRSWIENNPDYIAYILDEIRREGPHMVSDLDDLVEKPWEDSIWSSTRNAPMMINYLWHTGRLLVSHRDGLKKYWDLPDNVLPAGTPRETLSDLEVTRRSVEHALRALGAGTIKQIKLHYTRYTYPEIDAAIAELLAESRIEEVSVLAPGEQWDKNGPWYAHREALATLDAIEDGGWQPRTTLLSPFDNLICDRDRTELLWDFFYRIEIYVPAKKREFGYYVMPILFGDRLIGRIDPRMDRKTGRLHIRQVFAEAGAPRSRAVVTGIRGAIRSLGEFLGAKDIRFEEALPEGWDGIQHV